MEALLFIYADYNFLLFSFSVKTSAAHKIIAINVIIFNPCLENKLYKIEITGDK